MNAGAQLVAVTRERMRKEKAARSAAAAVIAYWRLLHLNALINRRGCVCDAMKEEN